MPDTWDTPTPEEIRADLEATITEICTGYYGKRDFLSPMLVSEISGHEGRIKSRSYVYVQPKLNGWCGMVNTRTRRIYTRNGREITNLPHINAALPGSGPEWLHGEYYIHGFTVDEIQSMIKRGDARIQFHVFDIVSHENAGTRQTRVINIKTNAVIKIVQTLPVHPAGIPTFYKACLKDGYEGIIIRLEDYGYEHKRSRYVFKMKPTKDIIKGE